MNFKYFLYVFVLLIGLKLCLGQRFPVISYISQEQIKDIGGSIEFDCSVQYARKSTVLWKKIGRNKDDHVLLSTGSSLVIRDSRFSLRYDDASSTYTLRFKDIQETDAGIYQCEVVVTNDHKITAEVELSIRRPPIIFDNSTQSVVASEGQDIQMECYASGYPTPTIIWSRENNVSLTTGESTYNGNVLKINAVRKEDRGTYYCVADNGAPRVDKRFINLEVESIPVEVEFDVLNLNNETDVSTISPLV